VGGPVLPLSPPINYKVNYLPSVLKENWINIFTFVTSTSDTRTALKHSCQIIFLMPWRDEAAFSGISLAYILK
jgi:hypothetical protein